MNKNHAAEPSTPNNEINVEQLTQHVNPKLVHRLTRLHDWYFKPRFYGKAHLKAQQPTMYIGNHTIYGVVDTPLLIDYLMNECGIVVISMADHVHFHVPVWDKVVQGFGGVQGLREHARAVMQAGYSILIFPGGGREVTKRKGEAYQLIWKQRYGFIQLAQEFNYNIVPFAAYGGDDVFDLRLDANDLLNNPLAKQLLKIPRLNKWLRQGEVIPSIPKQVIPKRVPLSFQFLAERAAPPVTATQDELKLFRDQLQQDIYNGIATLKALHTTTN